MRTQPHITPPPIVTKLNEGNSGRHGMSQFWKNVATAVALIASISALSFSIGKAYFVTRDEYTTKSMDDAVSRSRLSQALENLDKTMIEQRSSFDKLADKVNTLQVDVAVSRRK